MLKVIRAALIITFFAALASLMFAQHDHATTSGKKDAAKATCSCCPDTKDGKMAACCDVEKCKMDAKGNCTTADCCKKTGENACKKACAKATADAHSADADHADHARMACARKGGCCGGKAAAGGPQ